MNDSKQAAASGGIGFGGLLALLFIALKLLDRIDWSWWWVLSPFWLPVAVIAGIALAYVVVFMPFALWSDFKAARSMRRRKKQEGK